MLRDWGAPEFYDKLMTVPLLNLSVQVIDRGARGGWLARLERWQARFRPRRANLAAMGLWATLFAEACQIGHLRGRANLAERFLAVEGAQPGELVRHALDRLEQACTGGKVDGAIALVRLAAREPGLVASAAPALEPLERACAEGHAEACQALVTLRGPRAP